MLRRIVVAVCLLVAAVPVLEGVAPAAGSFEAGGSVNQVYVTGLTPGDEVDLLDADDDEVASGVADGAGALLFREIQAGTSPAHRRLLFVVGGERSEEGVGVAGFEDGRGPPDRRRVRLPDHP